MAKLIQFVETAVFTRRLQRLGLEGDLRGIQEALLANPDAGVLDPGTGGLRKLRVGARGKGTSGGARIHYLWLPGPGVVYLVFIYRKDEMATLTPKQKEQLKAAAGAVKKEWSSRL